MRLAVVVPYRDRPDHLAAFVPYLEDYLNMTTLDYHVFIIEQSADGRSFNRGAIKNVGAVLSTSDNLIFHDIDHLPIDADYSCPVAPTGLAGSVGGVVSVPRWAFEGANGYSNLYWGWGYEDTDLVKRLSEHGHGFALLNSKFRLLPHQSEAFENGDPQFMSEDNLWNAKLFEQKWLPPTSFKDDGLSSLRYSVLKSKMLAPKTQLTTVRLELS